MKVSINFKFLTEPFGGGAQLAGNLREYLMRQGVAVINNLNDSDIDVILNVNPFPFISGKISMYSFLDAYAYQLKHPNVRIVQRVNECDERKGTNYMNALLARASRYSDYVVFVGSWLKPLLEAKGFAREKPSRTILNGADSKIFNRNDKKEWDGKEKLKIVTHHWSPNLRKGHDAYQLLDRLLGEQAYQDRFEFTYVGSMPPGRSYPNTTLVAPISGRALAQELKKHHVYITASQNDPGPNHPPEAAQCGLPLLYINSGSLPEYCAGFGIEFSLSTLPQALETVRRDYRKYVDALKSYPLSAEHTASQYYQLFSKLMVDKRELKPAGVLYRLYFTVYKFLLTAYLTLIVKIKLRLAGFS